ncbi:homocitrate synthase [Mycolicibacterium goodii]|uniref:Homocitrate synthase n=1 Tax=Mycolicibacterium goodii TaxID=134601 RepID=A0A0K0XCK9_MYCGD|nr:homocitrate synthase [Mycolicibacterium goodii]
MFTAPAIRTSAIPSMSSSSSSSASTASFASCFAAPLPRGLRAAAQEQTWDAFLAQFAAVAGPVNLQQWSCVDSRPSGRIGPREYQATLSIGGTLATSSVTAYGPVDALTEILHAHGITVETTSFHQLPTRGQTATFIEGSNGVHREWAMGLDTDPVQSALRAVIACANRLTAHQRS